MTTLGCFVDIDVQKEDLAHWLTFYADHNGDFDKLTVSSDASVKGPMTLLQQIRKCARGHRLPLPKLLALVTSNTATALELQCKGRLEEGRHGDILVIEKDEFELVHVLAQGKHMVRDGAPAVREKFLESSNRKIEMYGDKHT